MNKKLIFNAETNKHYKNYFLDQNIFKINLIYTFKKIKKFIKSNLLCKERKFSFIFH